jgi:hypothetical protein
MCKGDCRENGEWYTDRYEFWSDFNGAVFKEFEPWWGLVNGKDLGKIIIA